MIRNLQFFLFLAIIILSSAHLRAQTDRAQLDIKDQKIEVTPTFEIKSAENIPEKKKTIKTPQTNFVFDSLLPIHTTTSGVVDTKASSRQINFEKRYQRIADNDLNSNFKIKKIEEPLFPDFKVEATQEQPYDNGFVSKEKTIQQLVKLEKVPADDAQITNVNTAVQNRVTISPSKRKYLEGVVTELEKEIQLNQNSTSIDMQAKKKELEDLKKLLIQ